MYCLFVCLFKQLLFVCVILTVACLRVELFHFKCFVSPCANLAVCMAIGYYRPTSINSTIINVIKARLMSFMTCRENFDKFLS